MNIAEEPKSPNMKTLGMIGVVCEANIRSCLLKIPDIKRTIRADGCYASIHTQYVSECQPRGSGCTAYIILSPPYL